MFISVCYMFVKVYVNEHGNAFGIIEFVSVNVYLRICMNIFKCTWTS